MTRQPEEKRERERVELLGELSGEIKVFQPLTIHEIGHGGCVVETAFPLYIDGLHELKLALGGRSIVLRGRVVHCRIIDVDQEVVRYRSGIEFVEPGERVGGAIQDFIDAVKDSRRF